MQISRSGAVGLAVAVAVLAIGWAPGAQPRLAAVNPVRPVAPDDVDADPSHGFLVLVEGDAALYENETEGPMAIGGDVRFRLYNAGLNNPGTYTLPGDDRPTSFVVGGGLDFDRSGTGTLGVLNQSYAKVGELGNATVLPSGGVTFVVPTGGDVNTRPALAVQTSQPAESVGGPSGFDFASLFALYRQINADMSACASTVTLRDQNGGEPWNGTDPVATLGLRPGQNVLTLDAARMAALDTVNPLAGALQPGDEAWLIVNVDVTGDYTWPVPNVSWQGTDPSRHVLWNFTTSGTITLPPDSGTVWGTVYAPNATLVDDSAANVEGAVIVKSLVQGGATSGSGGEIHSAPFADVLTDCATTPTTTTEPTTPGPTTTEPTTTTAGTTGPTATEPTTTAAPTPGTTSHPAAVHPDDDLAATGAPVRGLSALGGLLLLSGATALALTRLRDRRGPRRHDLR
ncbi:choice-of-anchor A family protein [Saccharothrix sp. 6-C]|uniref:collagen-binding domain-containing protein n=1 Tax=Saccharothrix sp. 6-C TaxID=2781735 RepID=UPI001916E61B|nr:collagen-binding domain-containing protein [Saccharothrix sp. 6-C]QQQ75789.1 choice-of-anchor A family protein [Saccharothrix sp. 6-C]